MTLLQQVEDLIRQKLEDKSLTYSQTYWSHMVLTNDKFKRDENLLAMLKNTLEAK